MALGCIVLGSQGEKIHQKRCFGHCGGNPHGGETRNNGTTCETCGMKTDEPSKLGETPKTEDILSPTLCFHMYAAAIIECMRNPSLEPVFIVTIFCHLYVGTYRYKHLWLLGLGPLFFRNIDSVPLRLKVFVLLAVSATEAAILWAKYKRFWLSSN